RFSRGSSLSLPRSDALHYVLELSTSNHYPRSRPQNLADLFPHDLYALRDWRKRVESFGNVLAFGNLWRDVLDEAREAFWIVASLIEILEPEVVRGALRVPPEFQIGQGHR